MIHKILIFVILTLILVSCKTESHTTRAITGERIPIDQSLTANTDIEEFIKPFSDHLNKTLDSVIAYNPQDLNKNDGELNTAIGNLLADMVMEQASPVFKTRTGNDINMVLLNHGGIRSTVGKGPITTRTAYNLMPFENEIVVAELKGEKIQEMLKYLESNRTAHPVSGIKISTDKNYKITSASIGGKEIDPAKSYFVATSDYLQQGGDNMSFFNNPVSLHIVDYKIRNALIDYFHKVDTLKTTRDDRYIKIE